MLKSLHERIIKTELMKKVKNVRDLLSIDLEESEVLCEPSKVNIGISAKSVLKKLEKPKEEYIKHLS